VFTKKEANSFFAITLEVGSQISVRQIWHIAAASNAEHFALQEAQLMLTNPRDATLYI